MYFIYSFLFRLQYLQFCSFIVVIFTIIISRPSEKHLTNREEHGSNSKIQCNSCVFFLSLPLSLSAHVCKTTFNFGCVSWSCWSIHKLKIFVVLFTGMWCIASLLWHDRFQQSESARAHTLDPLQDVPSTISLVSIVYGQLMYVFFVFLVHFFLLQLIWDLMPRWHEYQKRVHYYNRIHSFTAFLWVRYAFVYKFICVFFSTLPLFICDMRLQFWLFLRCVHYLHISLLFHVLKNSNTRHRFNMRRCCCCCYSNSINRQISTSDGIF